MQSFSSQHLSMAFFFFLMGFQVHLITKFAMLRLKNQGFLFFLENKLLSKQKF